MIRAGKLRHFLDLQEATETDDGQGGRSTSWVTQEQFWASIRNASERELFNAGQLGNVISHVLEARWSDNFHPDKRILFGSRIFQIVSVENRDEMGRGAVIKCLEKR